jgi:hypothetical protein
MLKVFNFYSYFEVPGIIECFKTAAIKILTNYGNFPESHYCSQAYIIPLRFRKLLALIKPGSGRTVNYLA